MTDVCLGLDIGGTNSRFGLVDRDGTLLCEASLPTGGFPTFDDLVRGLAEGCRGLLAQAGRQPRAIGIGAPNANHHRGTIEHAPNLRWKGVLPLASAMSGALGVPAWLTNDANAAALGEMLYGGGRDCRDLLVVTLGTGLGSGFVVDGRLLYGATGFAGELGHVIVDPGGRPCGCGRRGCLERYASVTGFVESARARLGRNDRPSWLRTLTMHELDGAAIHAAAAAGDELALDVYAETAEVLGLALANAVAITSPKKVFLYGGLAESGALLLEPVRMALQRHLLPIFCGVEIHISELQDKNGALLGAAALAFHQLETNDA
jgi:glucokinase